MKHRYIATVLSLLMFFMLTSIDVPNIRAQSLQESFADYHLQANAYIPVSKKLKSVSGKLDAQVEVAKGTYRLGNLINIIASQVKLHPSLSSQFVPVDRKVAMPQLEVTAKKALDRALKGTSLAYEVKVGNQLVFIKKETGNMKVAKETVTGTVTNGQNDEPLIGVNVLVKGTTIGTITDVDGHFSVSASLQDTLVFTYIGFKRTVVPINGRTVINVQLTPTTQSLEQMVVVGYGQQKKSDLTSSIASVDVSKTLESRPITSTGDALQGKVAGLTITHSSGRIGESPNITLRGVTGSLNGDGSKPLILVDGVEVPNLNLVDPHSIKSISVLKDAASTAIYGNRAAFGVILVTTKDGVKGAAPQVNYHGSYSFQSPMNMPTIAPAPSGVRMAFLALHRANPTLESYTVLGMTFSEQSIQKIKEWKEKYGGQDLGSEMVEGRDFEVKNGKIYYYRPWDAASMMTKKWAPLNKQNISISGGSENTSYRVGLGYLNQTGMMDAETNSWKRYNIDLALNSTVNDWLNVQGKLMFSLRQKSYPYTQHTSTYNSWYYAYRWPRVYPFGTLDGKPFRNAASDIQQAKAETNDFAYTRASLGATAQITKDLSLEGNITYGRQNRVLHATGVPISGWNNWDGYPLTYETFTSSTFHHVLYSSYWNHRINMHAQLHYQKDFKDNSFEVLLGVQPEWYDYVSLNGQKDGLLGDKGEFDLATGTEYSSGSHKLNTNLGYFGRINYSYKDKYLLQVNGRYTGSSFFPADQRFGFFPSASAGWVISRESFMDFARPILSFLKLRGSWGTVGHTVGGYRYLATMGNYRSGWLVGGPQTQTTFDTPQPISPSLTWEKVSTTDFGVDAKFFSNQLSATFDWYNRLTSDMITSGQILPETFGANIPDRNYGELRTRGWELSLTWNKAFMNNDLNLHVKGTLSNFHETITKFANEYHPLPNANVGVDPDDITYFKGMRLHNIWGYVTDRLFQASDFEHDANGDLKTDADGNYILKNGIADQAYFESGSFQYMPGDVKYKDLNGDGVISPCDMVTAEDGSTQKVCGTIEHHGDMKLIGNSAPHLQYGLTISGNYKSFDFRVFFQGVGNRQIWADGPIFTPGWDVATAWFKYQLDYWSKDDAGYGGGTDAFYPRPAANGNSTRNFLPQTRYLANMAYLRVKTITLGYSLPQSVLSKVNISNLRIYVSGENLFTIDNLRIPIDPETRYNSSASNTFGRQYPYHRTFSIGLDLKF